MPEVKKVRKSRVSADIVHLQNLIDMLRTRGVSKFEDDGLKIDLYPNFELAGNVDGHTEEQKRQKIRDAIKDAKTMASDEESELFWST